MYLGWIHQNRLGTRIKVIYLCSLRLKTWPLFLDHTFTIMELSRKPHELKRGRRGGRGKGEGGRGEGGRLISNMDFLNHFILLVNSCFVNQDKLCEQWTIKLVRIVLCIRHFYSYLVPLDHSVFLATLYHVNNICLQKSVGLVRLKLFGRPSFLVPFNPWPLRATSILFPPTIHNWVKCKGRKNMGNVYPLKQLLTVKKYSLSAP